MEKSVKQKLFQTLFVFLIIAVISFMIWMFFWIKGMSGECVRDPLSFYADHNQKNEMCDPETSHYEITCTPNNLKQGSFNFEIDPEMYP